MILLGGKCSAPDFTGKLLAVKSPAKGTDEQQGILLNVVVGIVGGLLGGFLLQLFGVDVEGAGLFFSFLTCLLGAVILLFVVKKVTKA